MRNWLHFNSQSGGMYSTIINTFLETYDFSGKKIMLLQHPEEVDLGNTVKELQSSASDAVITEGRLLNHGTKQKSVLG